MISPLINRTRLLPGESLLSLMERVALLNYCAPPSTINRLLFPGARTRHRLLPPRKKGVFQRLGEYLLIDPAKLYASTAHCFTSQLLVDTSTAASIHVAIEDNRLVLPQAYAARYIRNYSECQYCPECIAEEPYHRLIWSLVPVSICVMHGSILQSACPICGEPVAIHAIILKTCQSCGGNLARPMADNNGIPNNDIQIQAALQALINGDTSNFEGLADLPAQVIFRIIDGLRFALSSQPGIWHRFRRLKNFSPVRKGKKLPVTISMALYNTATAALLNWPDGFMQFLNSYVEPTMTGVPSSDFPGLYTSWLQHRWKGKMFSAVQQAFDEYVIQYYRPSIKIFTSTRYKPRPEFLEHLPYLTMQQTAKTLGLSRSTVKRMLRFGLIRVCNAYENDQDDISPQLVEKSSIISLKQKIYSQCREPPIDDNIAARTTIGLKQATQKLTSVGLDAANLLNLVAEGQLTGLILPESDLGTLHFWETDIHAMQNYVKHKERWIHRTDVARELGVKPSTLSKWVSQGIIRPVATFANAQYFAPDTVPQFRETYIFSKEAAKILGVGELTVQKWARNGRLESVTGGKSGKTHRYLFYRKIVEKLRPENRLTGPEMAKLLGISRSQLTIWVKSGKLQAVSGPGIDKCKHYLFLKDR